jgi:hypothetical protein
MSAGSNGRAYIHWNLVGIVKSSLAQKIDAYIKYERDYEIDYFGFKTLERSYLLKVDSARVVERPQHMWMRVALCLWGSTDEACLEKVFETYDLLSQKYMTHATPTLFSAGTPRPQLSSCYLIAMSDDSISGIYKTLGDCAMISKYAGGIGLHIHNIRARGALIRGTNGIGDGIVPMLRVFNHTAKYVDQCLDPETIIYTKRGAIPIKKIVIGDEVITDDGQFYEIGKVLDSHYSGDFYKMDIHHTLRPLFLTDMHPLWCIKNTDQIDCYHIRNLLDKKLLQPDFIEAKHIHANDYIGFPIPKYEKDIREYTENDCRFYGIFLTSMSTYIKPLITGDISVDAPFYIQFQRHTAPPSPSSRRMSYSVASRRSSLASNSPPPSLSHTSTVFQFESYDLEDASPKKTSEAMTIEFIEHYLNSYSIPFEKIHTSDGVKITWNRNHRFKFTYEMFYEGVPALLHLPKHKTLKLIQGILETARLAMDEKNVIVNCSSNMTEHLRYMFLRLGTLTSGNTNTLKIPINAYNAMFNIDVVVHDTSAEYFEYNGYLFSCVKENLLERALNRRVIDIEVDHDDPAMHRLPGPDANQNRGVE